jgi:hypothetical protein
MAQRHVSCLLPKMVSTNADCGSAWRLAVAPVVERRREWRPGSLPGVQAFRNSRRADAETIGDQQGARQSRPGPVSRLHGCRLPHRQGVDDEIADARDSRGWSLLASSRCS